MNSKRIHCNNPSLCALYLLRLTNLDFTHQDLPHPSVSMHFSEPSWGSVNATLHQACQLVDYTPDSSTRLLHYLHIKPQISQTDQQWSSGCPHQFFKHGKWGNNLLTQCKQVCTAATVNVSIKK